MELAGRGLGAAAEARIIGQRLYDEAGVNRFMRLVAFEADSIGGIPTDLKGYHYFKPECDFASIVGWITGISSAAATSGSVTRWLPFPSVSEWQPADCEIVRVAFTQLLTADASHRVLLIQGPSGIGKSLLTNHFLGLALDLPWLACGRFELKGCA
jgi:hypothetical protein